MTGTRCVAGLLLIAAAVAAEGDLASKARLSRGSVSYKVRRNYALPDGVGAAEKPGIRKGRVGTYNVFFFDVDGNGRFDEAGTDGWMLSGMRYILPLERKAVIELTVFEWRIEPDGSFVHFATAPVPVDPRQRKVLRQFNYWRLMNGLPPVTIDPELSDACAKHCKYMEHNGFVHKEEQGKTGYTLEGAEAGLRSCISEDDSGMSVLMFYATFYHRLPLLSPDTRAIGIGNSRRYTAVDGLSRKERRAWIYPVIVPAPATDLQPTHFAREAPRPYPYGVQAGFPITLTFDRGKVSDARATLRLRNAKGPEIRVLVSSPEYPANKKRPDNRKSICVIPRQPLPPRKVFWIKVGYRIDGEPREHEWLFKTGIRRPVPRLR
jgi:hypothetical protein